MCPNMDHFSAFRQQFSEPEILQMWKLTLGLSILPEIKWGIRF